MVHLPELIQDLALILGAAGIVTLIFKRLRQPVVLGYIIAGVLVGPYFPLLPTITETSSIKIWAEIGVVFLLFALGLEFSFKKLAHVGSSASITAVIEVATMVIIGFLTGRLFGWANMDSLFLGGILAISSTTIIIRAFDELGVKGRGFVNLVFGVLIVEDLFAILLLVLLSTVAISQTFSGTEMINSGISLLFFLTLWFVLGIFLLPTFLKRIRPFMNAETLLVVSVALCLMMVVLATQAGFSPALGAFIMGSILAETADGEKIEHLVRPVKDLFAAVFFVSVGMLIDPNVLYEYAGPVFVITLVTIFGKALSTMTGALISGRGLRHAIQSGLSLAQIGEFSFIIATLGLALKVTSDFLYPVVVGVSAVTTFTTPYMIKSADSVYKFVAGRLPKKWTEALDKYSATSRSLSAKDEWQVIFRSHLVKMAINSVLITAVFLAVERYLSPFLSSQIENERLANGASLMAALLLSAPFLWALVLSKTKESLIKELWANRRYRKIIFTLEASRWLLAFLLFGVLATQFITFKSAAVISIGLTLLFLLMFSRHISAVYISFEKRFVKNLSAKDDGHDSENSTPPLAPWDAHLVRLEIKPESHIIGKSLEQLGIRENFGVTIALIERGSKKITAPSRHQQLFPNDKIAVIGTDEQIHKFKEHIEFDDTKSLAEEKNLSYTLQAILIDTASPYCGLTIRDSGIRENSHGLVVGIERKGQRLLNPDSQMRIEDGDLLWIVGDAKLIKQSSTKKSEDPNRTQNTSH